MSKDWRTHRTYCCDQEKVKDYRLFSIKTPTMSLVTLLRDGSIQYCRRNIGDIVDGMRPIGEAGKAGIYYSAPCLAEDKQYNNTDNCRTNTSDGLKWKVKKFRFL